MILVHDNTRAIIIVYLLLKVMREMLGKNMRQNLQMVVQIATAYSDQIGADSLIEMLESFKLYEGLFYYLGAIINNSTVRRSRVAAAAAPCIYERTLNRILRVPRILGNFQSKLRFL